MPVLNTKIRNRLESPVKQARRTAEAAAKVKEQINDARNKGPVGIG